MSSDFPRVGESPQVLVQESVDQSGVGSGVPNWQVDYGEWAELDDITYAICSQEAIMASGVPNHLGCRILVRSKLNIGRLGEALVNYHDKNIVQFVEFGFPMGTLGVAPDNPVCGNHWGGGATKYPDQLDAYIKKELGAGSILDPFHLSPFSSKVVLSALITPEKRDLAARWLVMYLSLPQGRAVNDMVSSVEYLGSPMRLLYPLVDDLVDMVKLKGRGCALYKRDLSRAFRQFPLDHGDYNLLGFTWKGQIYFNTTLPMSLRTSPFLCQRTHECLSVFVSA